MITEIYGFMDFQFLLKIHHEGSFKKSFWLFKISNNVQKYVSLVDVIFTWKWKRNVRVRRGFSFLYTYLYV